LGRVGSDAIEFPLSKMAEGARLREGHGSFCGKRKWSDRTICLILLLLRREVQLIWEVRERVKGGIGICACFRDGLDIIGGGKLGHMGGSKASSRQRSQTLFSSEKS